MRLAETVMPRMGGFFARALMTSYLLTALLAAGSLTLGAQTPADDKNTSPPSPQAHSPQFSPAPVDLKSLPRNLFQDQKNFWTTPFHMTDADLHLVVPLAFAGAALIASDTAIEKHVPTNPSTVSHAVTASNAGLAAMAGIGGGMFLLGHYSNNDQERETGLLSGEAGIDALLDTEVFKYAFGRERPFTGSGKGHFFQGGTSFPSEHAAISWAIASVIAHEYPGPLTEILAYGLAGGVGAARIVGHQHFASDVIWAAPWVGISAGKSSAPTLNTVMRKSPGGVRSAKVTRIPAAKPRIWVRPTCPWIAGSTQPWIV
jgi:hypothetical protein